MRKGIGHHGQVGRLSAVCCFVRAPLSRERVNQQRRLPRRLERGFFSGSRPSSRIGFTLACARRPRVGP